MYEFEFGPVGNLRKSTDGGRSWFFIWGQQVSGRPIGIAIDPRDTSTVYVGTREVIPGVFRSTDSGVTWAQMGRGLNSAPLDAFALAPSKPNKLYAIAGGFLFRSTNRGKKWSPRGDSSLSLITDLVVDPSNPNTVYLTTYSGVLKSTDGAETFQPTALFASVDSLVIDPKNTLIIYTASASIPSKVFKSTDGGASWTAIGADITGQGVTALAIDPSNSSVIYAGTFHGGGRESFVTKINPTGTALGYSTYLGGTGDDVVNAIAVDAQGNAYLTGQTSSADFPTKSAIQTRK